MRLHWQKISIGRYLQAHGRDTFYYFGALGLRQIYARCPIADAGCWAGLLDFLYDTGTPGIGGEWAGVSLYYSGGV